MNDLYMYKNDISDQIKVYTDKKEYNNKLAFDELRLNSKVMSDMMGTYFLSQGLEPSDWKVDKFEYDEKNNVTSAIVKPIFDFDKALERLKTSRDK